MRPAFGCFARRSWRRASSSRLFAACARGALDEQQAHRGGQDEQDAERAQEHGRQRCAPAPGDAAPRTHPREGPGAA